MEELRDLLRCLRDYKVNGGNAAMGTVIRFRLENYERKMEEKITELKSLPHQTRSIQHEIIRTTSYRNMAWMSLRRMRRRDIRWYREAE